MPSWPEQDPASLLASLLLSAVCLHSALLTFQINRGAAAWLLLQALLETLPLGPRWQGARPPDPTWSCTVVGLPLLAFAFHWLNGDYFTANVLLGSALLLAGSWGYFTKEGKAMAVRLVVSMVTITIFVVSVFTGSTYGMVGSWPAARNWTVVPADSKGDRCPPLSHGRCQPGPVPGSPSAASRTGQQL